MKRLIYSFLLLGGITFLAQSCYNDIEDELYPLTVIDSNVTYKTDIGPIIQANCVSGCHQPGGTAEGVAIFDNSTDLGFAEIKKKVDQGRFENRVVVLKDMPPSGPLSNEDIAKIQLWLADGALNN